MIRTRGSADEIYIDLHLLVPSQMYVDEAHTLREKVEEKLKKIYPESKTS
ncbi:MAG: cation transporter dimerization domain-containing protein [Candidatus Altiarchaeota archaeon]